MSDVKPSALFKAMRSKVVGLIRVEDRMTIKERKCQQWQILFQIKGFGDYIVGKGGANTMFYMVDGGERKLCFPQEMIQILDKWCADSESVKYHVAVNKKSVAAYDSKEAALKHKAPHGAVIVKVAAGKKTVLYVRTQGLMGASWKLKTS